MDDDAALKTALRVLTAIDYGAHPASADVEELRSLVPEHADYAIDALACEVINTVVDNRAEARAGLRLIGLRCKRRESF